MTSTPDGATALLHLDVSTPRTGEVQVALTGDLGYETADELLHVASEVLGASPAPHRLTLDCAELGVCDSMGLSTLLMLHRRTLALGTELVLLHRRPPLVRLLEITGTLTLFAHADSPDPATEDPSGPSRDGEPG
ncbi:STAS domain-containing protein [Streptomyces sp. NPDC059740]|uniref:STAS domain-containing protein n=1 Tax=Streptomyces sp. NPDC059740 TaxID=3346926 RepID=UPI0036479D6A